jgi:hypothetical protein
MEDWRRKLCFFYDKFVVILYLVVFSIIQYFHHSNIPELCVSIVLIKIITRFLIILQGAGF